MLLDYRAAHIQHMQKALQQMNIQLTQVLTDITGTTGFAIIRAIVAGKRDPAELARFRDPRCARSAEDIANAFTGHYQTEHVFTLQQALALYDSYTAQLRECDAEIAQHFQAIKPVWSDDLPPLDRTAVGPSASKNAPAYEAHSFLYQLAGVDLLTIPGLQASTAQTILAEIGLDRKKWPNEQAFCAWLGLAPRHEISGGQVLRRHTLKTRNRAGHALRLAAQAAGRSARGLGAFYRRMRARLGPKSAIVATAHKIARILYHMLTSRTPFREQSPEDYAQKTRAREIAAIRKKAARLGLTLVEGPRSWDRPPCRYSIKSEVFEKYRYKEFLNPQFHRRWPKVADAVIKAGRRASVSHRHRKFLSRLVDEGNGNGGNGWQECVPESLWVRHEAQREVDLGV